MTQFQGTYLDGKSSNPHPVTVCFDGVNLHIKGEAANFAVSLEECEITPPLGRTRRSIRFPSGAICETDDLNAIGALENIRGANPGMRLVHLMENRWKLVAVCFAGLVVSIWLFGVYGIPFLAKIAANSIPPDIVAEISKKTERILEERFFEPSELDEKNMSEIRDVFLTVARDSDSEFDYRLEFRRGNFGPNAFALPSGLVIMTDSLVRLSGNHDELAGIFRHEIAHIENRHGMRTIFQNAGIFLLVSAVVGDVASITSVAASFPTLLAETGYSRTFEKEADEAAGLYFLENGQSTKPYRDILTKITKTMPDSPGNAWLSTHPGTRERVRLLLELEESWNGFQ